MGARFVRDSTGQLGRGNSNAGMPSRSWSEVVRGGNPKGRGAKVEAELEGLEGPGSGPCFSIRGNAETRKRG